MEIYNKAVVVGDSDGIKVVPSIDVTDYELKYVIKKEKSDSDTDAVKSVTPTLIDENSVKKISVVFPPETFVNVPPGNYHHALKVISPNKQTAITLFMGFISIEDGMIEYPVGV